MGRGNSTIVPKSLPWSRSSHFFTSADLFEPVGLSIPNPCLQLHHAINDAFITPGYVGLCSLGVSIRIVEFLLGEKQLCEASVDQTQVLVPSESRELSAWIE